MRHFDENALSIDLIQNYTSRTRDAVIVITILVKQVEKCASLFGNVKKLT